MTTKIVIQFLKKIDLSVVICREMMTSAIVTGCAGFIGSHLVEKLLEKKWKVIGIDNFHPYYSRKLKEVNLEKAKKNKNFVFVEGSILFQDDMKKLSSDVDYVFHFAAIAGVRNSLKHPEEYFKINLEGTKNVLNKFKNVKKFVFASSSSVYGDVSPDEFPVKENHALNPIAPYGESKKQAEKLCLRYAKDFDMKIAILRFYTVYGPRQRPDEAFTKFIRLAQVDKPIPVYGDGTKERDFTFVSDIVNGVILAAEKGNGIYNLGTGNPIILNQMISSIEKAIGKKIHRNYLPNPEGDVQKTHADITKAKEKLGFAPQFSLENGVAQCVSWCFETSNLITNSLDSRK